MFEKMTAPFTQMFTEQNAYADAVRAEMQTMRERQIALMKSGMEDFVSLTRAGMSYQTDLMSEMQKISADTLKSSMSWMNTSEK